TATINGSAVTSPAPTVTVSHGAVSTVTSVIGVSSASVPSGSAATLSLQARDAAGNPLASGGLVVAFTATAGTGVSTGTMGTTTDHGDGTYSAVFSAQVAGTAT